MIIGRLLYIVFVTVLILAMIAWLKAVRAYVKAIATRNPGVSLLRAMNGLNLFFRSDLYEDEREQWLDTYWRGCVGILLWCAVAALCAVVYGCCCGASMQW